MEIRNSPEYHQVYTPSNETKLYIIVDSKMPIITKVPVPPGLLTLGKFKAYSSLKGDAYKFYFKSHDSEFGTVKEELVEDDSVLPVEDGQVVAWVISNKSDHHQTTLFGPENFYDKLGDGTQTDSMFDLYKQPAHLESYYKQAQEHVYDQMMDHKSTNVLINLYLNPEDTLGLTIICPSSEIDQDGLLINRVQPNTVAARDGRICPGDKITEINGVDVRHLSSSEAVAIFRRIVDNKGAISLCLHRDDRCHKIGQNSHKEAHYLSSSRKFKERTASDGGFDPATELPAPLLEPDVFPATNECNHRKTNTNRSANSLPRSLTPRSLYTTSNFDTLTSTSDLRLTLDSQSVYGPTTPSSVRQIGVALHCSKDSIATIYAHLKSDSASLDIRDREWLKVVVKEAFLGSTLVKWLSRNVYGFCNRSETKRYANRLLSLGLIRSPMSSGTFSEKCYYVLT